MIYLHGKTQLHIFIKHRTLSLKEIASTSKKSTGNAMKSLRVGIQLLCFSLI